MKTLATILFSILLLGSAAVADDVKPADQKWIEAVSKMVSEGKTTVSTPQPERAELLKKWAAKQGYSAQVTKTEKGYRIELSKSLAKK